MGNQDVVKMSEAEINEATNQGLQMTEEEKIEFIKDIITTDDGWKILASSLKASEKPNAKQNCIELLQKITPGDELVTKLESFLAQA